MSNFRDREKSSRIATNFLIEFGGERVAFIHFYQHVQKQLCQEVLDFFLFAFQYKYEPVCNRMLNEKVIYDLFVAGQAKKQINLAEKMRKKIESKLGAGLSTIFDEAVQHVAESLGTNFWISFIRTDAFTNIDRRPKIIGAFDLKKTLKKSSVPKYIHNAALFFFHRDYDLVPVPKVKYEFSDLFEKWLFVSNIPGWGTESMDWDAQDKARRFVVLTVIQLLIADPDPLLCMNAINIFYDHPRSLNLLFSLLVESNISVDPSHLNELITAENRVGNKSEISSSNSQSETKKHSGFKSFGSKSEKSSPSSGSIKKGLLQDRSSGSKEHSKSNKNTPEKAVSKGLAEGGPSGTHSSDSISSAFATLSVNAGDRSEGKKLASPRGEKLDRSDRSDPFLLTVDSYQQLIYRYYLLKCMSGSKFRSCLKTLIVDELFADIDGQVRTHKQLISSICSILSVAMKVIDESVIRSRLKLLFQVMYNVALPKFENNKGATLHAIAGVLLEYICYCVEYPVFIQVTLTDGARFKQQLRYFTSVIRSFAYRQINSFSTPEDLALYEQFLQMPVLTDFIKWVGLLIEHGVEDEALVCSVEDSINAYHEIVIPESTLKAQEYVSQHFITKRDLIKGKIDEEYFGLGQDMVAFLSKSKNEGLLKKAAEKLTI